MIYHTIVWGYQNENAQRENIKIIEAAGARAGQNTPLAWLRLEPDGKEPGPPLPFGLMVLSAVWAGLITTADGLIGLVGLTELTDILKSIRKN